MFSDCEGCYNLEEDEEGKLICNRTGQEISRIHSCEDWNKDEE